jgi:hypothetical protein
VSGDQIGAGAPGGIGAGIGLGGAPGWLGGTGSGGGSGSLGGRGTGGSGTRLIMSPGTRTGELDTSARSSLSP